MSSSERQWTRWGRWLERNQPKEDQGEMDFPHPHPRHLYRGNVWLPEGSEGRDLERGPIEHEREGQKRQREARREGRDVQERKREIRDLEHEDRKLA